MENISNYIYKIGLPLLEKKGQDWNFRCTICGDSKKSEYKKRGWILNKNGNYIFYCHNCGASMHFTTFLKRYYNHLYLEYIKETFVTKTTKITKTIKDIAPPKINVIFPLKNIICLSKLPKNHICELYIKKRKISFKYHNILYYCENFQKEINKLFPEKFTNYPELDERLIIPFFNKNKKITYIQGRTISNNYLRYITINLISDSSKIYGVDRIDISKLIYIVEGPIDSLFLDNCLAMGSASINYNDLLSITNKQNFIFIYDLETRNKEIIKKIKKSIDNGFKICLLPNELRKYGKDINQFIQSGLSKKEIQKIIKKNTFSGLQATVQLNLWKKC